ncbi:MAG: phosphatidate cytidylyltransferase [Tannerellaceae bacterium]|jgi:phosphatidate cytidylyltransferase|nr:phosphatidate cytidylyltransferase [Tannerellaceae bacterium]
MKQLVLRAFTGSLFIGVILAGIYLPCTAAGLIFALFPAVLVWELLKLDRHPASFLERGLQAGGASYLYIAVYGWVHQWWGENCFLPYIFFLMYILIAELFRRSIDPLRKWSLTVFGQVYCGGSLSLLSFFSGSWEVMAIFVTVWVNDTAAYLVGSQIGRHKFFESVSPKKSWEGFWGGFTGAMVVSQVLSRFHTELSSIEWVGFSLCIVVSSTFGDLVESLLKRTLSVKDSGHSLPGHGGFLDRFDSSLMAIPAAYIFLQLVR